MPLWGDIWIQKYFTFPQLCHRGENKVGMMINGNWYNLRDVEQSWFSSWLYGGLKKPQLNQTAFIQLQSTTVGQECEPSIVKYSVIQETPHILILVWFLYITSQVW